MNEDALRMGNAQLAAATMLILLNAGVSLLLELRLERTLLLASLRTVGQLLLIGMVLQWIFARQSPTSIAALLLVMTLVAGWAATSRLQYRYARLWLTTLISMWGSSWLIGGYGLALVFPAQAPWYRAQLVIPVLGMILGNTLNGISLGLNRLLEGCDRDRLAIETRLAMGATRWEAVRPVWQASLRTGMMPIINAMMIVGLVSLPGMMTGQLLAGADPAQAVRYQIALMFLIASATAAGTLMATTLACRRLLNQRHQLEAWRLSRK